MNFDTNNQNPETPNTPVQEPVAPAYPPTQPPVNPNPVYSYPQPPVEPQPKKDNKKLILGIAIAVVAAIVLFFGYMKYNEDVFEVEEKIDAIGTVTLDSEEDIIEAEEAFADLTKSEQGRVSNKDVLEKSRDDYNNLLIDSFESSLVYSKLKELFLTGSLSSYSPKMYIDRDQKALLISLSMDSELASFVENYPSLARESWTSIVDSLNTITSTCYSVTEPYRLDALLQLYPSNSATKLLFESKNGTITYNILN